MSKSKKMNTQIYLDFINNRKTEEANQYKDSFIPKTLYKYYPLFDERYSEYKKENKIRFDTIEGNELWVSGAEYLNDPFDLKAIYLDEKVIQERGYQLDLIRMLLDQSRKSIGISCFSNNFNNNMPMWAHYSN